MTHAIGARAPLLEEQIRAELATATLAQLDHQAARLWKEHAAGTLDEAAIDRLSQEIHALKAGRRSGRTPAVVSIGQTVQAGQAAPGAAAKPARTWSIFEPKKRRQRRGTPSERLVKRRLLAASSGMPNHLAANFTTGEAAVLFVVGAECFARGWCDRSIDELADRASASPSTVKRALRLARSLGLIRIEERPQKGKKHLTNVIRIISREWAAWLAVRKPIGGQTGTPSGRGLDSKRISRGRSDRPAVPGWSKRGQNQVSGRNTAKIEQPAAPEGRWDGGTGAKGTIRPVYSLRAAGLAPLL